MDFWDAWPASSCPPVVQVNGFVAGQVPWLGLAGSAEVALTLASGGRLRMELKGPLGVTGFAAVARPDGILAWDIQGRRALDEPDPERLLAERSGMALGLDGLVAVLLGRIPAQLRPVVAPTVEPGEPGGDPVVPEERAFRWTADAATASGPAADGDVAVAAAIDPGTGLPTRISLGSTFVVRFERWSTARGCVVPTRWTIDLGKDAGRIRVSAITTRCAAAIDPARFVLKPPATVPRVPLGAWL